MKKLILLLLIVPVLVIAQGEQRYADGTATDQDGNTFEWINYGTQDWSIENAEVEKYRDGTEIPYNQDDWTYLTTGAWRYYDDNPSKGKLYNWYAVMGINDNDPTTPLKEFAPEGWHIPSDEEWTIFEEYLIANGYNYDDTMTENKIAKSMASTVGWGSIGTNTVGAPAIDQSLNNSSGFNAFPTGAWYGGHFQDEGSFSIFLTSTEYRNDSYVYTRWISNSEVSLRWQQLQKKCGFQVRFVRNASTASTKYYSDAITIYPNPTTSIVTLQGGKQYDIEVYTLQGKKVMALTGNKIDMSHLSSATYIVKALDKVENEEVSYKVVKN